MTQLTARKIAEANFGKWAQAVEQGDPKRVTALFSEDAVFLPTLSGSLVCTLEGTEEYFQHFLGKAPVCKLTEDEVRVLSDDVYCHAGIYAFELTDGDRRIDLDARFSFIWSCESGSWRILHFHSSLMPS